MVAAVDWSSLTVAGAFVLGAVVATVAVLRLVRSVAAVLRAEMRDHSDGDGDTT